MKKLKKIFLYLLGLLLAYTFNQSRYFAYATSDNDLWTYGPATSNVSISEQSTMLKIFSIIFTPINILIVIVISFIIGGYIYYKRKRNVK